MDDNIKSIDNRLAEILTEETNLKTQLEVLNIEKLALTGTFKPLNKYLKNAEYLVFDAILGSDLVQMLVDEELVLSMPRKEFMKLVEEMDDYFIKKSSDLSKCEIAFCKKCWDYQLVRETTFVPKLGIISSGYVCLKCGEFHKDYPFPHTPAQLRNIINKLQKKFHKLERKKNV